MRTTWAIFACAILLSFHGQAADVPPEGLRIFTCGHSFHYFMPALLESVTTAAGITNHETIGLSAIGGLPMTAHWNEPDAKNKAKTALRTGRVDVLTLSPMWLPDVAIAKFANLALEQNSAARITVQEFWLPNDEYEPTYPVLTTKEVDRNAVTIAQLRERHAPYFKAIDEEVQRLNDQIGKPVLFVVPVGQAVLALREKAANGEIPGVGSQSELFSDRVGHPRALIQLLVAYCHYAVIYRKSPVGLPLPGPVKGEQELFHNGLWTLPLGKPPLSHFKEADKINRLLQELAWTAATQHPLSGVTK